MRRLLVCAAALAAIAGSEVPAFSATKSIKVSDNYFVRARGLPTVTVERNDTASWRFVGRSAHTVTVRDGPPGVRFGSKPMASGLYRKKMSRRGTYKIFCRIHGVRDM